MYVYMAKTKMVMPLKMFSTITNSVALVRERTTPTQRPPLVGEVSANFCGYRGVAWSVRRVPYGLNLGFLDQTEVDTPT
jgi:hypothetical protein